MFRIILILLFSLTAATHGYRWLPASQQGYYQLILGGLAILIVGIGIGFMLYRFSNSSVQVDWGLLTLSTT